MISVVNNMGSQLSQTALVQTHGLLSISLERLSTGIRINRAEDDAAGLIVRDRFQAQMNGFTEGIRNIQTAQGMIQVAEQGLNTITQALQTMRSLAVRAADDNLNDSDRASIQQQVKGLLLEINNRADSTVYNGHNLLNGSIADAHEERLGSAQIQSNSFLSNGTQLVTGAAVLGNNATAPNSISQGSYEVKLVYDASRRDDPVETTSTALGGSASSGLAYLNNQGTGTTVNVAQTVIDRLGASHAVNLTFTKNAPGSSEAWTYHVTGGAGGAWTSPIDASGTVNFDPSNNGHFSSLATLSSPSTQSVAGSTLTINVADGSQTGQNWGIDFSKLRENDMSTSVASQNMLVDGTAGAETTSAALSAGNSLDADDQVGTTFTGSSMTVVDRTGVAHLVGMTWQKTADQTGASNLADTWSLTLTNLTGGALNGSNTATTNVAVVFDTSGNVLSVNGQAGQTLAFNLGDGTSNGQNVTLALSNLKSVGTGISHGAGTGPNDVAAGATATGTPGTPTTTAVLASPTSDRLVSGHGPVTIALNNIIDRNGVQSVPGASVTFTQVGDTNVWDYQVNAPAIDSFTGGVSGGTGSVSFDETGNLIGPKSFVATLNDGTQEGQQLTFKLDDGAGDVLTMGRASNLGGTSSNGSLGTGPLQINAELFYSDSSQNTQQVPIATLLDVSAGAQAANLGGVSFTVNQVSSLDVGLTAYVKAYTYVSATTKDNALQFQVGPDEGMIQRIGIAKMDVQTLFRGQDQSGGSYLYTSVKLNNTLQAQDLIGEIDDALNFVSTENLKVGQFANNISRTLDLQRQNDTSITGAESNLNDADMAAEATSQSKRMVLTQSGTAMVAQANSTTQFLLQLLR